MLFEVRALRNLHAIDGLDSLTERLLEIVCEASRTITEKIKQEEPDIDWRKMIDFGNLLRHAYHTTKPEVVWDIIENHLPPLKSVVERRIRASGK
jgi:uncharacterized protein with HEPN domain